jgi:hypothetical protein
VVQQVAKPEGPPLGDIEPAQLGQVKADVVVQSELAPTGEDHHRQGRQLLGHRGKVERRRRRDRNPRLDLGQAVPLAQHRLSAHHQQHGGPRPPGRVVLAEPRVDGAQPPW